MTKHEKYIKELAKTTFVSSLTTSMVGKELCAKALLQILLDKGIITYDEWIDAMRAQTEHFVKVNSEGFEELYEPDFISFVPDE